MNDQTMYFIIVGLIVTSPFWFVLFLVIIVGIVDVINNFLGLFKRGKK